MSLNAHESLLARRAARGEPTVFPAGATGRPIVSADLIRSLLLGLAIPNMPVAKAPMPGVRLSGARIVGRLALADSSRPGTELPALELADCEIDEPIDLTAARLSRLSLVGSRFSHLDVREAFIDGPFDFSHATGPDDGNCWIDARGALINGDVNGTGALLRVSPRAEVPVGHGDRRHALWLAGCTIRGSVRLMDFAASGGISLDTCRISGDLRMIDAVLASEEGDAFRAQNANIEGTMLIRGLVADGTVWFLGLRTGGILQIEHTWIRGERRDSQHAQTPHEQCNALIVGDADIGASVRLTPDVHIRGRVNFAASKIRGFFEASQLQLDNRTTNGRTRALDLTNAEVGANLIFDGAHIAGRFDMAGARIGGKLSFLGSHLSNRTEDGNGAALEAINVTVGGNAEFGRSAVAAARHPTRIEGELDFTNARVGGDLRFSGVVAENFRADGEGVAIKARQVHVQASLLLNHGFRAHGAVLLASANIGRDFRCIDADISNPARSAIYAKDIEIGDDIKLESSTIGGDLRFERAMITGRVFLHELTLQLPPARAKGPVQISLAHGKIGSALHCDGITFAGDAATLCAIDLRSVHVATIDLSSAHGWGRPDDDGRHRPVQLDGLTYERIEFPRPEAPAPDVEAYGKARVWLRSRADLPVGLWGQFANPPADDQADALLDWILRNADDEARWRFNPQPFRQLTRVLRAQGHERAARNIAIHEQWATPRSGPMGKLLSRIYGAGFGFGLWPKRAAVTLGAYVLLGWFAAFVAYEKGWLVETPQVVATSYSQPPGGQMARAVLQVQDGQATAQEVKCGYISNAFFDTLVYAIDTVLPFIPLHQETKCELRTEEHELRFLRAIYTIGGWVITSIALLTFSGVLRRAETGEPG